MEIDREFLGMAIIEVYKKSLSEKDEALRKKTKRIFLEAHLPAKHKTSILTEMRRLDDMFKEEEKNH